MNWLPTLLAEKVGRIRHGKKGMPSLSAKNAGKGESSLNGKNDRKGKFPYPPKLTERAYIYRFLNVIICLRFLQ